MFFKERPVLLVDDEPDVLAASKLSMKNFDAYGLPLKIYAAASKADAIRLLDDNADVACSLAVAFLDLVMENDKAGLELCDYIRDDTGNKLTQIFIRTGQPGLAPEREVIDKYEINGYYTKIEATEDKLYSLVKSAVRQYLSSGMTLDWLLSRNGVEPNPVVFEVFKRRTPKHRTDRPHLLRRARRISVSRRRPGDSLYLILSGLVDVLRLAEDETAICLATLGTGKFIGELAIIDGGPRSASVRAKEPTELFVIPRRDFLSRWVS